MARFSDREQATKGIPQILGRVSAKLPSATVCIFALLTACAAQAPRSPPIGANELLSATTLFGAPVDFEPIGAERVTALDEEMRAFVQERIRGATEPQLKLARLMAAMQERGLSSLEYSQIGTRTVQDTFHAGQGNCLSFTMLFVALAREAGLRVSYQMVDTPPAWSSVSGVLVRNNHINTLIKTGYNKDYTVDFNLAEFRSEYTRRLVSDDYALALFYNNMGAEALINEDYETSFAYLSKALQTYPDVAGAWNSLGLLYSRQGLSRHAESAYLQALKADPRDRSALTNLVALYNTTGQAELAAVYADKIDRYQKGNPYHHFFHAQQAYREQRFEDTLDRLKTAIRLKVDEREFYLLQGLAHRELGQADKAQNSLDTARRYEAKIETLSLR